MYGKVICNKEDNGKKASTIGKTKTKIMMLAVSGLGFAMVTFSGCDAITEQIEKPTEPTTGYIQQMEETTQRFEEITEDTTEISEDISEDTTEISEDISEVTTKRSGDIPVHELQEYSNLIEEMQARGMFEERHDVPLTDEEYNELLTNLNNVLSEKNFSYEGELLIRDTFESLCNNYYTWQKGYLDMPSIKEYINSNFINSIKVLNGINFIDINSDEASELYENGESDGALIVDEDGNKVIRIIAKTKENDSNRARTIEIFFHEVGHLNQDPNHDFLNKSYEDEFMNLLFLHSEGGATETEKLANRYEDTNNNSSSWVVTNDDNSKYIKYTKSNDEGYIVHLNLIEKEIMLVGYKTYEDIQKGKVPFSTLRSKLIQYYGEKGEEFFEVLSEFSRVYENDGWKGDEVTELAIKVENLFLELIEANVNNITSIEQLERYKEIIDQYNLPIVLDNRDGTETNIITKEVFRIKELRDSIRLKEESLGIQNSEGIEQNLEGYERG